MTPDVLRELAGLRALARSLVHGDADAEDLVQDAAAAALAHPPAVDDRPVRPWLAAVLRNRWRMDRRAAARRQARHDALAEVAADDDARPDAALDRARTLERLGAALVALDEPFRTTVVRRYLDGESAADIARAQGVPAGTVRWRLSTGLARLRAALDKDAPRWQRALAPLALPGAALVKTKASILALVLLAVLLGAGAIFLAARHGGGSDAPAPATASHGSAAPARGSAAALAAASSPAAAAAARDPRPGQGRATIERAALPGGALGGRVINWSTGDGVAGADLTFTSDAGATTIRTAADGAFELAPPEPGAFTLSAVAAKGFLPYAPELAHSPVRVELARDRAVRGVTVFLFPALDYAGTVVDARGAPAAGAHVRLLGTPAGEQAIDHPDTEWVSDAAGHFTFHAADDAVLEAERGSARGWGRLDGNVALTHQLVIALGDAPAHDRAITGRAVDEAGAPLADVLVRALPADQGTGIEPMPHGSGVLRREAAPPRATAFATTGPDGAFALTGLDGGAYDLTAETDDRARATQPNVAGGTSGVTLALPSGALLAGSVVTKDGAAVPAFTLLVARRAGVGRELVLARSVVAASGHFRVRVAPGEYELTASASGWAPSAPVTAKTDTEVQLVVTPGATLRGTVVAADGSGGLAYARVMREGHGGGASATPANAGTVTREDGSFELTGIPAGPLSITIGAGGYHPRIEAGLTASDDAELGPITIALAKLAPGETPQLELVGIGVQLAPDGDALKVERVIAGGGAEAAGIVVGDRVAAVDGTNVQQLGIEGAVAKIRGNVGTTVVITLLRGDQLVPLTVERRKLHA